MIIILLGPPGAGKGTIAGEINKKINIPVIATGDILRSAVQSGSDLGKEAREYINYGKLAPDHLIMKIIENRIQQEDCKDGYLFDGFPRTIQQAQSLDLLNKQLGRKIDQVFYFRTSYKVIIERLSARRVCSNCGNIYNLSYNPPVVKDRCDKCTGKLLQRNDDKEETIRKRLEVYHSETFPLVKYYSDKGILTSINADQEVEERFKGVWKTLIELDLIEKKV